MEMPENERTLYSDNAIYDLCNKLNKTLLTDDDIQQLATDTVDHYDLSRLLSALHRALDDSNNHHPLNYNRYAHANMARFTLCLFEKITSSPSASSSTPPEPPPSPLWEVAHAIWRVVRYPIFLFAQFFGYLNNIVTTYTSLDRSFWNGLFSHATVRAARPHAL